MATTSASVGDDLRNWLKEILPGAFSDGELDVDAMRESLGLASGTADRYSFSWAGKQEAVRLLQTPSRATLLPKSDASVSFDDARHSFIQGDNLEVLKLLYRAYFGRVKAIYIDPPYNTGNQFVYPDDYADPLKTYLSITRQTDDTGNLLTSNPETAGRYHSSWLSMMYPRLFFARQLLSDDGVIFVSIDDSEVHHLRLMLNEIFGEENFLAQVTVQSNPKGRGLAEGFARSHDYVVVYARSEEATDLSVEKSEEEVLRDFPEEDEAGRYRLLELRNTHRQFGRKNRPNLFYPFFADPETGDVQLTRDPDRIEILPLWDDGYEGCWSWHPPTAAARLDKLVAREVNSRWKVYRKSYVTPKKLKTVWLEKQYQTEKGKAALKDLGLGGLFDFPKPVELIKTCIDLATDGTGSEIVLDFFAGACTTAQAVMELNEQDNGDRQVLLVQLPEPLEEQVQLEDGQEFHTLADIGLERIRRVLPDGEGLRVFHLSASHYKRWAGLEQPDTGEYVRQMQAFTDPLVDGWATLDVLWEVAIKEGYGLDSRVDKLGTEANDVWRVEDSGAGEAFMICLDEELHDELAEKLDLSPDTTFVCLDSALSDGQAANLALQCRLKTV